MKKFLVISYDNDQQQWFYDTVFAETAEAAKEKLLAIRNYCQDADTMNPEELRATLVLLEATTQADSEGTLRELAATEGEHIPY